MGHSRCTIGSDPVVSSEEVLVVRRLLVLGFVSLRAQPVAWVALIVGAVRQERALRRAEAAVDQPTADPA
jgi:hypothetical protein